MRKIGRFGDLGFGTPSRIAIVWVQLMCFIAYPGDDTALGEYAVTSAVFK